MTFRAFISVDVESTPKLSEFEKRLKGSDAPLKLVDLENIHLTLKFLGETDEALIDDIVKAMTLSIENVEPFTMEMKGTGAFPNLNYMKVIWVGLENADALVTIAKTLDRELTKLGFKREKRGFHPHITMARVKGARKKNILAQVINEHKGRNIRLSESGMHKIEKERAEQRRTNIHDCKRSEIFLAIFLSKLIILI